MAVVAATIAFRWFNRASTGELLRDLLLGGWNGEEAKRRLNGVSGPVFTGAYKISTKTEAWPGASKVETVLWAIDVAVAQLPAMVPRWGDSLRDAWADLCTLPNIGPFMAYEIVSDLRWTDVLAAARDVNTWASAGPGCANGLAWLVGLPPGSFDHASAKSQATMLPILRDLLALSRDAEHWPFSDAPWELREAEHFACEAWKYVRCRDRGQPPRERYRRASEQIGFVFA